MAQKYLVQLIDDLTQEQIQDGAGESVTFGVDGAAYAIDLTDDHAAEFRALLEPYVAAAQGGSRDVVPAAASGDAEAGREGSPGMGVRERIRGLEPGSGTDRGAEGVRRIPLIRRTTIRRADRAGEWVPG